MVIVIDEILNVDDIWEFIPQQENIKLLFIDDINIQNCYDSDIFIINGCKWLEFDNLNLKPLYFIPTNDVLMLSSENSYDSLKQFRQDKIKTNYPNILSKSIGIFSDFLSNDATNIFDIQKNGYRTFFHSYIVIGTAKGKYQSHISKGISIAFDGVDGCGKTALSQELIKVKRENPTIFLSSFSSDIGMKAKQYLKRGQIIDWAKYIINNRWNPSDYLNKIYDRHIMTLLTELLNVKMHKDAILDIIKGWNIDYLFYCYCDLDTLILRTKSRITKDEYDNQEVLKKYYCLYNYAYDFIKNNTSINIIKIDTNLPIEQTIKNIKQLLPK